MRVLKNAFYVSLMQASNILLGLLVIPYITRTLGPHQLGISSFGYAAAYYCALLGQLGISIYGLRRMARERSDPEKRQKAFSECYAYQLFFGGIGLLLYNVWAVAQQDGYVGYYLLFNLTVLSYLTDLTWVYAGLERFDKVAIRTFIMRVLGTALIFLAIRSRNDLHWYIIIQQGTMLFSNLFFWSNLKRHGIKIQVAPLWHSARKIVRESFWLFLPSMVMLIASSLDRLLLGYLTTKSQVALYDFPMRLARAAVSICGVAGNVMLPRLAGLKAEGKYAEYRQSLGDLTHYGLLLGLLIAGGIFVCASEITGLLLGDEFRGADTILRVAVLPITLSGMGLYFAALADGKEKKILVIISVACALSLIGYLLFIPEYGAKGAVFAYAIPEFLTPICYLYLMRKQIPGERAKRFFPLSIVALLLAVIPTLWLPEMPIWPALITKGALFTLLFAVVVLSTQREPRVLLLALARKAIRRLGTKRDE